MHGSRVGKREDGWGEACLTPLPSYLGGNTGAVSAPTLPVVSVAAAVTVP